MANELQRRYLPRAAQKIAIQERADGAPPIITGYAAVFYREGDTGTEFELWPGAVERIAPGAFSRAIKEDDVRGLFNHAPEAVLGRNGAGTLRLVEDAIGLRYEIDPPDTQLARDLIQSIKRGDVSGSSFAFIPHEGGTLKRSDGARTIYERTSLQLFDVGPVTYPAYSASSVSARAMGLDNLRQEEDAARAADLDAVAVAVLLAELEEAE